MRPDGKSTHTSKSIGRLRVIRIEQDDFGTNDLAGLSGLQHPVLEWPGCRDEDYANIFSQGLDWPVQKVFQLEGLRRPAADWLNPSAASSAVA